MFTDLKPYPSYDQVFGAPVDQTPAGWTSARLGSVARLFVSNVDKLAHEHELPVRLCNYVDVYKNEFLTSELNYMHATASSEEVERFKLRRDDVIITKDSESWTDIGIPAYVTYEAPDLVCGYHLAMLRTTKEIVTGAYVFRALQVPRVATQLHVAAGGVTRYGLSHNDIRTAVITIPNLAEQAAITRYLGRANARIDRATAAKRRLIALLEEQKQAIINHAVTRGLDPTISLKSSGVPWIGDIPSHWKALRLKQAARVKRGRFTARPRNDPSLYDGAYPFVQTGSIARADRYITTYDQTLNERGLAVSVIFPKGSLVMAIAANIGDVAVLGFDACCPDSIVSFTSLGEVQEDLLFLILRSAKAELVALAPVNTQGNLSVERITSMSIPVPPAHEQYEIVKFIDAQSDRIRRAVDRARSEIELLREFRTRLTADVVTGQLDVREVAARLPDLDPSELAENVSAGVDDDLDEQAAEFLEDVET